MLKRFLMIGSVLLLTSCASASMQNTADGVSDPIENLNRATFEFNYFVDGLLLKPLGALYRDLPPPAVRESMDNFLTNLDEPLNFINGALQGDVDHASRTLARFIINTTIGVFGLFDVADVWFNMPHRSEDFGQTLAVWGAGDGSYIVLPIIGPSNTRDSVGRLADLFMDPFRYVVQIRNGEDEIARGRYAGEVLSTRAATIAPLEDIEQGSVDFYASLRSLYKQNRDYKIMNKDDRRLPQTSVPATGPRSGKKPKSSSILNKDDSKSALDTNTLNGENLLSMQELPPQSHSGRIE